MSDIRRVYSQPNASSLKEGEEVVYLGRSKPLAKYRKEGGQVWVSYMTTNGDLFVEKDFNVQGTISQGGTGGGSGPPIVKGGLIEQTAGGVGVSTSGTTGAVSFASGTPTVGTLPVNKGGTAVIANTTWVNSNVVMKADGVLGYDGSAVACTMNTLADDGNIRSRVTAGLDSNGDVDRTVAINKGGTNATDSDIWLNTRVVMKADGVVAYDNNAVACTMNTLADANNIRARVTGSLASGNGLNSSVAIGDALNASVIFNGHDSIAKSANGNTITNSIVWQQNDDTSIIKASFNYLHNSDNRGLKLSCLLRTSNASDNAVATLSVYPQTVSGSFTSGSLPDTSASPIITITKTTDKLVFDSTHTTNLLGITTGSDESAGQLADGSLYKITIGLHSADDTPGVIAYMTAATVVVYGS